MTEWCLIYLIQAVHLSGYLGTWQIESALNQEQLESFGYRTEWSGRMTRVITFLLKVTLGCLVVVKPDVTDMTQFD